MSILDRFGDIIKANINAVLDKMEDPSKMIDQYMRDMTEELAEVKEGTAGVMAEEARTRRMLEDNKEDAAKYADLARKAVVAKNDGDARVFIAKKQELEQIGSSLEKTYAAAHENAFKMRQMHDKLVSDIQTLTSRREMIKAKVAVAKTQESVNKTTSKIGTSKDAMSAFERMEEKADRMLDVANATSELNAEPVNEADALENKYAASGSASVDDELAKIKGDLGIQ